MSFQQILDDIRKQQDVDSVVVLDADGETIWSCGRDDSDVLRLTAAHQSVLMGAIRRAGDSVRTVFSGCENRWILTHHLKDGYLITVIFSADVNFARAHFLLGRFYDQLEAEL
jgi:hypothetical protein